MKRLKNVYNNICSIENLQLADSIARRGKLKQHGVIVHDRNKEANILALHECLMNKQFATGAYHKRIIHEPKEREISILQYFPDRIVQHAIMNVLEPMFVACFTADSYSCIKGRGIHAAKNNLEKALKNVSATQYCLKLDITKFYPSVDHEILKELLRRKIKDNDLLTLLDGIIDSAPGLPIGNYLSQYFANFYLNCFDHWLKEVKKVKYYFRYADDIVILMDSKADLHELFAAISQYLESNLKLQVKGNYQVFPVEKRGIDFLGYVFYHTHILLRKRIKQNFARMLRRRANRASLASYMGWALHCNSYNLLKNLLKPYETAKIIQRSRGKSKNAFRGQNHNT